VQTRTLDTRCGCEALDIRSLRHLKSPSDREPITRRARQLAASARVRARAGAARTCSAETGRKCRAVSSSRPRCAKRGASQMDAARTRSASSSRRRRFFLCLRFRCFRCFLCFCSSCAAVRWHGTDCAHSVRGWHGRACALAFLVLGSARLHAQGTRCTKRRRPAPTGAPLARLRCVQEGGPGAPPAQPLLAAAPRGRPRRRPARPHPRARCLPGAPQPPCGCLRGVPALNAPAEGTTTRKDRHGRRWCARRARLHPPALAPLPSPPLTCRPQPAGAARGRPAAAGGRRHARPGHPPAPRPSHALPHPPPPPPRALRRATGPPLPSSRQPRGPRCGRRGRRYGLMLPVRARWAAACSPRGAAGMPHGPPAARRSPGRAARRTRWSPAARAAVGCHGRETKRRGGAGGPARGARRLWRGRRQGARLQRRRGRRDRQRVRLVRLQVQALVVRADVDAQPLDAPALAVGQLGAGRAGAARRGGRCLLRRQVARRVEQQVLIPGGARRHWDIKPCLVRHPSVRLCKARHKRMRAGAAGQRKAAATPHVAPGGGIGTSGHACRGINHFARAQPNAGACARGRPGVRSGSRVRTWRTPR